MKTVLLSAIIATAAVAGHADQIVLSEALAGASLHEGGVDMSVYYTQAETGLEVVATYANTQAADFAPQRVAMLLQDGDNVTFGLPGKRGVVYSFARTDNDVTVSSTRIGTQLAQR